MSIFLTSSLDNILQPTIIALGNFDGIHRGHQQVIKAIFSSHLGFEDIYPTLVTFTPHPQEFFTGQKKQLLTPIPEKSVILESLGIKQLILLPFDRELATLTPIQFVEEILIKQIKVKFISVGEDFRFGHNREGNALTLKSLASQFDVEVMIIPEQTVTLNQQSVRISSSYIRSALTEGDLQTVKIMLGRDYQIQGKVIKGQQLGRTIGFPTANLAINPQKFLPRKGVYTVEVNNELMGMKKIRGVMNIGDRPTVNGKNITVEVHLLDWRENLYGETLTASLIDFIRPEQKFSSLSELKKQIEKDCQQAQNLPRLRD